MKRYCYRTPKFPPHAFVGSLIIRKDDHINGIFTLSTVYTSTAEFCFDVISLKNHVEPDFYQSLGKDAIVAPIVLEKTWPLKKEYWENPTTPLPAEERQKQFIQALDHFTMYKLLATPYRFTKPFTMLSAALPLPIGTTDATIEQFMKSSTYPVLESANQAAIYTFEQPYGIEWKTGKIIKRTKQIESLA